MQRGAMSATAKLSGDLWQPGAAGGDALGPQRTIASPVGTADGRRGGCSPQVFSGRVGKYNSRYGRVAVSEGRSL
jgi:hypothetical protein